MFKAKITAALFGLGLLFTNVAYAELFGSSERKSRNINEFPKWIDMLERFQEEEFYCVKNKKCLINEITEYLEKDTVNDDKFTVIKKVNRLVNSVRYITDLERWGQGDYWATPTQFFEEGGDCEDYAIAKFTLLKKLGFKSDDMRIVVLNDTFKNIIHSVLVVYIEGKQYLLDNEVPKVLQAHEIRHYKPIFSINEKNWWKHRI